MIESLNRTPSPLLDASLEINHQSSVEVKNEGKWSLETPENFNKKELKTQPLKKYDNLLKKLKKVVERQWYESDSFNDLLYSYKQRVNPTSFNTNLEVLREKHSDLPAGKLKIIKNTVAFAPKELILKLASILNASLRDFSPIPRDIQPLIKGAVTRKKNEKNSSESSLIQKEKLSSDYKENILSSTINNERLKIEWIVDSLNKNTWYYAYESICCSLEGYGDVKNYVDLLEEVLPDFKSYHTFDEYNNKLYLSVFYFKYLIDQHFINQNIIIFVESFEQYNNLRFQLGLASITLESYLEERNSVFQQQNTSASMLYPTYPIDHLNGYYEKDFQS